MAQISYIKYVDVLEARRYDAEYFKPECLKVEELLKRINSEKFGDILLKITGGATPLGAEYSNSGIPFLRVQNIMQNYFNDDLVYITEKQDEEIKRSKLKEKDVLLTITGVSYGKSAVVEQRYDGANINQHSVLMRFKNDKNINSYFVSTFLNCYYGKTQSDKNIVGLSRPALDYDRIKNYFLIPIFDQSFQLQIEQVVKSAHQKQSQSKQLYREAEELLLQELGLLDYQVKNSLTFTTTKKEIEEAHRYDSEYFQPKYEEIIKKIEQYKGGFDIVKNIFKQKKWVEVWAELYTDKGNAFIRVSDFSIYGITDVSKKIPERIFNELKNSYQPKKWEILFTKDGTIGISYVLKESIEGILSWAFLRLTLKEEYENFEKECLALILNSIICKMQIEKLSWWALIAHLKPSDFETLKIPLLKADLQHKITLKLEESYKLRKESKELLEKAKEIVEKEIEKNW